MKVSANAALAATFALLAGCLAADPGEPEEGDGEGASLASESSALIAIDPCSRVRCRAGTQCEVIKGRPFCVPNAVECVQDSDCRLFSNYCEGCSCVALSTDDRDPICEGDVVACFVDPCMNHQARCERGQCVDSSTF